MLTSLRVGQVWQCEVQNTTARVCEVDDDRFRVSWVNAASVYNHEQHGVDDHWICATPDSEGHYRTVHGYGYTLTNLIWDPTDATTG